MLHDILYLMQWHSHLNALSVFVFSPDSAVVDIVIQILVLVCSNGFAVGMCRMYIMYGFFFSVKEVCVVCKGFLSRTSFMLGIESWALASVWPGRDGPAPVSSHTRLPQQPWAMQWLCHGNYSIAAVCRNTSTKEHTHAGLTCCLTRNHKGWHDSESVVLSRKMFAPWQRQMKHLKRIE